jgi:hypothetical protein
VLPVWEDAATADKQNNKSMQLGLSPDNAEGDMSAMRVGGGVAIALPKDHARQKIERVGSVQFEIQRWRWLRAVDRNGYCGFRANQDVKGKAAARRRRTGFSRRLYKS